MWFWISFLLLGLFVYLPIGTLVWFLLVVPLVDSLEKKQKYNIASVITFCALIFIPALAILVHGGLFGWYDKLEKPDNIIVSVDEEVQNDFYKYEEKDGQIFLTVSDKNYSEHAKSHLVDSGYIHFDVANQNAKKARANLKWLVEIDGKEYTRDSLPTGTEIHLFSDSFSLKTGENNVKITAKNDLGETTETITITKLSTETECGKPENSAVSLCQKVIKANLDDSVKTQKAATPSPALNDNSNNSNNSNNSTNTNSTSGSSCSYYEYGQCWDEVLDQAYEDGYLDAYYGGHAYYRECDGICAEIYEDAYERGNYYGQLEYGQDKNSRK